MPKESSAIKIERSQKYFNKLSLFFYDFILYGIISRYAWGSSIQRLDAHYKKYIRPNHLEVGVGTGFLLDRVAFDSARPRLALMDLSQACLEQTRRKLERYAPQTYIQNLLEPVRHEIAPFDSIGINYVMHCVPGSFREKSIAFSHLMPLLNTHGVLFGTTVLSEGVRKNVLTKPFMWLMNALGVFNNRKDNARDLEHFLKGNFQLLEFEIVGVTAFFAIKNKS
ncbi:MAG: class I SAM-dependent methyltransferase [Pseudomonadota bacterium]